MAASPHPQVRLDDLPMELIDKIVISLETQSICALHAISRSVKAKCLYAYSAKCFGVLKFCLYPFSLQALTDISNHPDFTKHVHTVAFNTDDFGLIDQLHGE
ncbi:hypothetical protein EJ02DRAFT_420436 [Clathrospora elynae]|uniref:F-box domain-containing protein n=1 Tax=Clathrospora elynae TaxID=706981 RepID=A0A6A5SWY3_9PLEO|nr:hypothetical protein EJ02DRAFT_420436 [Clathrospora elynae]